MQNVLDRLYAGNAGQSSHRSHPAGTPDPTKYHAAREVLTVLPGNHGFANWDGGVVIPRHRAGDGGGSMGFDPHKPPKVYVDPELTGGQICIDFANLTKSQINQTFKQAMQQADVDGVGDHLDRAAMAYAYLSEASKGAKPQLPAPRPETGITSRPASFAKTAEAVPPPPPTTSTPAPFAAELPPAAPPERWGVDPSPARLAAAQRPFIGSIIDDVSSPPPARTATPMQHQPQPLRKVLFELPQFGMLTGYYHDVVRTEDLLILVFNHAVGGAQHVWFPKTPPPDPQTGVAPSVLLGVLVHDADGAKDTGFIVCPTPVHFQYQGLEFCVLAIEKEKSFKEAAREPQNPG